MKRTTITLAPLIIITVAGLAVYATQRIPPDKRVAAEVLDFRPNELVTPGVVDVRERPWGEQRTRIWRVPGPDEDSDSPQFLAEAEVDLNLGVALYAYWATPDRWGPSNTEARYNREECVSSAEAFASQHYPHFEESPPDEVEAARKKGRPSYLVNWTGRWSRERVYRIDATVSAVSGKVTLCSFSMSPNPPKATRPVTLSPEEAETIVRKNLPENVTPDTVEAYRITTDSTYAPYGEPVYQIKVNGTIDLTDRGGSTYPYSMIEQVHATTGELLPREGQERRRPIGYQTRYIEKLHSEDARDKIQLTGEEAKEVLKDNLREDMKNPKIDIRELTDRSHFAPEGEPVYVAQIEFDVTKPDGEEVRGEVVWGVHAETGELIRSAGY